jgi:hypothetical protein
MAYQFRKHYTLDEARALLPQVRLWLQRLKTLQRDLEHLDKRITSLMQPDYDVGGDLVNQWVRTLAETHDRLADFQQRDIQIKDLDRGLIDFPAVLGGREVFFCWEEDEEDIEFWHELDAGYAGRERL